MGTNQSLVDVLQAGVSLDEGGLFIWNNERMDVWDDEPGGLGVENQEKEGTITEPGNLVSGLKKTNHKKIQKRESSRIGKLNSLLSCICTRGRVTFTWRR